jgi:protease-4
MKKGESERPSVLRSILTIVGIISGLLSIAFVGFLLFGVVSAFSTTPLHNGNVAIIPIHGVITPDGSSGILGEQGVSSKEVIGWLREADSDANIKAVILDIESPGGTPVASEEMANEILKMNKPTIAVIHELGASGAYWVASAADKIFANRMSEVGSIGVLASYINFAGTLNRYNATYESLTAGQFKDAGSPYKPLTPQEEKMFRDQLDKIHTMFIQSVAQNRGLPEDKVRKIATGWVYLGSEALDMGLIDKIGNQDDALAYIEDSLNITAEPVEFQKPLGFFQSLSGVMKEASFALGRGIGTGIAMPKVENNIQFTT